ncbi:peptide deformylase [Staphylococcus schleiferi subsp. coagulans]|uniref:peptide deformylase n=1 Tax=Staphylococcus coagulans TaxID=74706 RepID=UPI0015FBFFDC|nr:peptide deformylase [Staphylococcus coagulans]MBA8759338.1 peptide deformylase [Staphylococcus coagulans]MBA8767882.1 peptide deformylase [Staphylococcus coagulans]
MLTMKDIIRDGHPTLRQRSMEVEFPLTDEERQTLLDMQTFLRNSQDPEIAEKYQLRSGVGLAAPQINVPKRMFAIYLPDDGNGNSYDMGIVNPKIVSHSVQDGYLPTGEGCLSVDEDVPGLVHRHYRIKLKGYDIDGNEISLRLKGYPAIVVQHELDHLDGVLFYDRIDHDNPLKPKDGAVEV